MTDSKQVRRSLTLPVGDRDHIQGSPDAATTLVFYGDYQCPVSAQVNDLLQTLQQQQPFCLVFRHFPQPQRHPQAQRAAEAAEAAASQGKFWNLHHLLFQRQNALENGFLVEYAIATRLEGMRFLRELSGHVHAAKVQADYDSALDSGVDQAPACFINGLRYQGTWDEAALREAIESC
jgi:protein-disulfide isomerase